MLLKNLESYILGKSCTTKKIYKHKVAYFVNNKIFALVEYFEDDLYINLKNKPYYNKCLRDDNSDIHSSDYSPYHWNSILVKNKKDLDFIFYMIDISYDLCIENMNKRQKNIYIYKISA